MTRCIVIKKGYRVDKAGKLVLDYKHLPVNLRLQKQARKRFRVVKSTTSQLPIDRE